MVITISVNFSGVNMGPLLLAVADINPALIFTAVMITATIFTCFTLASLLSGNSRQFIYLGGKTNLLARSQIFFQFFTVFDL